MRRRDFFGMSMAAGLAINSTAGERSHLNADTTGTERFSEEPAAVQSEDGVVIHSSGNDVMKGSPPADTKVVTLGNYESSRSHHSWAAQHMRELCPTQVIWRGRESVAVLPRNPHDFDKLVITDLEGRVITLGQFLARSYTEAFLVLHQGHILAEQYFSGMAPDRPHRLYSVAKSLLANVVAILADEGRLSLEARISDYVHELADTAYAGATLQQLLDMQSGVKYEYALNGAPTSMTEHGRHYRAAGMYPRLPGEDCQSGQYGVLASLKTAVRDHGLTFSYKCSDTIALMWACERVTGCRYADLLSHHVWSKLGVEHDASIVCDVQGSATPFGGMSTTLRDLARWGQMHLKGGTFRGRRILPEQFLRDIQQLADPKKVTKESLPPPDMLPPGCAYCRQYWLPTGQNGPFLAWGGYGQYCYISPGCETVIVKFSTHSDYDPELGKLEVHAFDQIARCVSR